MKHKEYIKHTNLLKFIKKTNKKEKEFKENLIRILVRDYSDAPFNCSSKEIQEGTILVPNSFLEKYKEFSLLKDYSWVKFNEHCDSIIFIKKIGWDNLIDSLKLMSLKEDITEDNFRQQYLLELNGNESYELSKD